MRNFALAGAGLLALAGAQAQAHSCYRRVSDPPRYATVEEQVMVSPARQVLDYTPAVTRQVEETVVVRPQQTVIHEIPAQYGYQSQTVEVSPARREWRVRDEHGDTIGCWVNVPARLGRINRRVEIAPAREVSETIPEQTATRLRTEIVEPGFTVARVVPAQYATRERQVLASPGGSRWAPLDACER